MPVGTNVHAQATNNSRMAKSDVGPSVTVNNRRISNSVSATTTTSLPESGWGSNFWVTLTDPTTGSQFYANPSSGQTSWDAPVGNFVYV